MAPPPAPARARSLRGILWMVVSTLWMASMHGAVRHLSAGLHPLEIAFFANFFGLIVVLPWFVRSGLAPLRTRRFGMHALRAALHVTAMFTFFYALSLAPLTLVTALAFAAPVFATLLAVPVFGERAGPGRWGLIVCGFAGTLVILRPGLADVSVGAMVTLVSTLVFSGVLVTTKALSRTETSVTITAYMLILMSPLALIPALAVWAWPRLDQLGWLVFIGVASACGRLLLAQAFREAATHVVMPFDFCRLIWVAVIGYLAFGETPDVSTWVGGAMIVGSGAVIACREHAAARRSAEAR